MALATTPAEAGYLEPTSGFGGDAGAGGPYTIAGIFGKAAPNPLVSTGQPGELLMGGLVPAVELMSGVQTVDIGNLPNARETHRPHARNLLRPAHSEAFWVLLIALAAFGLFGARGAVRLGPVEFGAGVGKTGGK
jgi:hypothetical protein